MLFDFDKPTNRRGTMSVKWDETRNADELPLWVADMDFETAPAIVQAVMERASQGIYGYVYPSQDYYDAIIGWFKRRHNWHIEQDWIVYTPGVVPAISACIKALTHPGDGVIIQTPVYNCFFSSIRNNGCMTVESPLKRDGDTYVMDFDDLERCCADERNHVLLLCNPHNPAGRVWTRDELRRVDEICGRHGVTVISDEIHCELVFQRGGYVPYATVSQHPCVVCTAPSKAFNTAGLQTSNMVIADPTLRSRVNRAVNDNEVCDIGVFGPVALIAAYNDGAEWLDQCVDYIHANYKYLCERLAGMPFDIQPVKLEGTYLAWVDVHVLCDAMKVNVDTLSELLREKAGVWFTAGTAYGRDGEGYLRINLATQRATLAEALTRLSAFVHTV